MKNIFLFCDTIIVDLILAISKNLVSNNYRIYLQCEKIKTKDVILKFIKENKLENKITVMCLDDIFCKTCLKSLK